MAVDIKEWTPERITYAIVPEEVPAWDVEEIKRENKIHAEVNGYSQSRAWKKIGELPFSVLYNYALAHGQPSHKIDAFFKEDNGKNMKRLLNEFSVFRVGDTPIGVRGLDKFKGFIIK